MNCCSAWWSTQPLRRVFLRSGGEMMQPQGEDLTESSTSILAEPARGDRPADASSDSVRLWLREISQFPRLSWAQEQALAKRIEQGRSEEHTSELQSPDHLVCR